MIVVEAWHRERLVHLLTCRTKVAFCDNRDDEDDDDDRKDSGGPENPGFR